MALAAREMPRWVRLACAGCVETTSWACAALYVGVLMAGKPRTEHPILTLVHDLDLLILNVLVVAASAAVAVVAMITRAPASKSRPALHMALPSGHGRASCAGEPSPGAPGPLQLWACRLRT